MNDTPHLSGLLLSVAMYQRATPYRLLTVSTTRDTKISNNLCHQPRRQNLSQKVYNLCLIMPKSPLSVSLVIPAYNEESHLRACLSAVCAQTVPFQEIIVVDNNSTDRTAA